MANQVLTSVENNFTKGLITEATGLNFPENAATDTDNCIYTLIGDVTRREGFDYEANAVTHTINTSSLAVNTYKWNNVAGDGQTQIVVTQTGNVLSFYVSSNATVPNPLSTTLLAGTVNITSFVAAGNTANTAITECQFADGNGYLFVYHPNCDPFYCSYNAGVVTGNVISLQIRDFTGANEASVPVNYRPSVLNSVHLYNLANQGWTQGNPWSATASNSVTVATGNISFSVASGISGVTNGTGVTIYNNSPQTPGGQPAVPAGTVIMAGNVQSYSGTNMVITVTGTLAQLSGIATSGSLSIIPTNVGFINTWLADIGNYPSNSDVWWYFKDNSGVFNPTTTIANVNYNLGQAPQGHYVLPAFNQDRATISGIPGLSISVVSTPVRPTNGAWFQGRVWYTGANAQFPGTGSASYYTWTENVYFSQTVTGPADFGSCYQVNDPTSQDLNGLLPTDGGVLVIQGSGAIYKLFPIQNGLLVFAANGVWFITGSQGIGFAADDYTVTKISSVTSISCSSYVDVLGLPYFWNEDGIYQITPTQGGALSVQPLTVGTIETFYDQIPLSSKKFVRGSYHPIDYTIQWVYNPNQETGISNRYNFCEVLNYNTYNKAFYPYTISTSTTPKIIGINYVQGPGGSNSPDPVFKYFITTGSTVTFSEENNADYVDWETFDGVGVNFLSYFVTGYKLRGQGIRKFQPQYIQVLSRQNGAASSYKIQGIWDYANSPNSGRWSTVQVVTNALTRFDSIFRRHKIRGHGYVLQFKVQSVDSMPFDIQGWAVIDTTNTGA